MRARSSRHLLPRAAAAALILIGASRGTASAQYHIDSWTTEHGLPQSSVFSITQTPDGFLWLSTFGGLARFDGSRFRVFDTTTNPEMPSSRLAGLRVAGGGRLWVLTQERHLMLYQDGRFRVMGAADGLRAATIRWVFLHRGDLVVETPPVFLVWRDGRFVADPAMQTPAEAAGMRMAGVSVSGARWYRDANGLAHRFEAGQPPRTLRLPGDGNVFEERSGRVWTGEKGRLFSFDGQTLRKYDRRDGMPPVDFVAAGEGPDGTLWFYTEFCLVRLRDERISTYTTADGLPGNSIRTAFRDREGTLWVGTNTGLARLTERPIDAYTTAGGLAANNTHPILQDRGGDIWIGGWAGLTRYRNGAFENVSARFLQRPHNVLSLMEDRDGAIWVGMHGEGDPQPHFVRFQVQ